MMKLILCLIIVACCTYCGIYFSVALRKRAEEIRDWKYALQMLEAEIVYGQTTLAHACEKIAAQLQSNIKSFFLSFSEQLRNGAPTVSEAWNTALEETWKQVALQQTEKEIIRQFGETIGQYDRFTEQKQIQLTFIHLEREETLAREELLQKGKMYRSLGILAGLLIVIIIY